MNEKTTKPDADLSVRKVEFADLKASNDLRVFIIKAQKMEFLDKLTIFAEQAKERLIKEFPNKDFNIYFDPEGMMLRIDKSDKFVILQWLPGTNWTPELSWLPGHGGEGVQVNMDPCEGITVNYHADPNILEKCVDTPFEKFTNTFEKSFAQLLEKEEEEKQERTSETVKWAPFSRAGRFMSR